MCVCVCARACVHACVRACACACVGMCACVCAACMLTDLNGQKWVCSNPLSIMIFKSGISKYTTTIDTQPTQCRTTSFATELEISCHAIQTTVCNN